MASEVNGRPAQQASTSVRLFLIGSLFNALGYGLFFPILPLFLRERGASEAFVGVIIAAGLACFGLAMYPGGWLADRMDRRKLMIASAAGYGAFFFIYFLPIPSASLLPLRMFHAAVGGALYPVAVALIADLTPPERRARAYGLYQATNMSGLLLGPILGGLIGGFGLQVVFTTIIITSAIGLVPLFFISSATTQAARDPEGTTRGRLPPLLSLARLSLAAAPSSYISGIVTAIWTLFLTSRGASPFEIGASFTIGAIPAVALSARAGSIVDRRGGKLVLIGSLIALAILAPLFAFAPNTPTLILLYFSVGVGAAGMVPAAMGEANRLAGQSANARAQALVQLGLTIAGTVGATVAGLLYATGPGLAFATTTVACLIGLLAIARFHPAPLYGEPPAEIVPVPVPADMERRA